MDAHDLDRRISEDERKLWPEVKRRHRDEPYESVRTVAAGEQAGLHPSRVRQIVQTWDNDGIVRAKSNGNLCRITTVGESFEFGDGA